MRNKYFTMDVSGVIVRFFHDNILWFLCHCSMLDICFKVISYFVLPFFYKILFFILTFFWSLQPDALLRNKRNEAPSYEGWTCLHCTWIRCSNPEEQVCVSWRIFSMTWIVNDSPPCNGLFTFISLANVWLHVLPSPYWKQSK